MTLPSFAAEVVQRLNLKTTGRGVRPGREIVTEGRPCNAVFLITEGVAIRYRILRDGQRQILNFVLPGDFAGVTSCRFDTAIFSIKTLMPSTIHPIPLSRLVGLFESHPSMAARLFWTFANDAAIVAEHLIAIGRRSAVERVAHLLLELWARLRPLGLAEERGFRFPLTQEIIGDMLGLSIPYVNRVLHQLRDEGLMRIKGHRVEFNNLDELTALADFKNDYLKPRPIDDLVSA